jgi:hypothetical protein
MMAFNTRLTSAISFRLAGCVWRMVQRLYACGPRSALIGVQAKLESCLRGHSSHSQG